MCRPHPFLLCVASLVGLLVASVAAQTMRSPETVKVSPQRHRSAALDVPQPPRGVLDVASRGRPPSIPQVASPVPQPDTPPCVIGDLRAQPKVGQFTFFRNRDQRPGGAGLRHPGEPSATVVRDTWFATGNTYGALSRDSGMSWTHVNPYTLFPAADGGVCCDQRVLTDPRTDLTLWFLHYAYSATTGNGGLRLAWAQGRGELREGTWRSVYLSAADFGFAGHWLDFPDLALSAQHVYLATNVYEPGGGFRNALVIRIPLSQITGGGRIVASYYRQIGGTDPMGGGFAYRFTQAWDGQPTSTMYWASHSSSASLRVFAWDDASSARSGDVERQVAYWAWGTGSSIGPDGRDWLGADDHRIGGAFVDPAANRGAFLWSSNMHSLRPQTYVRVQPFDPRDRTMLPAEDIWNPTYDFAYPAAAVNSLGHVGVVIAGGSATSHVTTYAFVVDDYLPWFRGVALFALGNGTHGAPSNRWGDFFSVVANPVEPRTFLGTGMFQSGGIGTASTAHTVAWFGRDDYTPAWVALDVVSAGVSGVPIVVDEVDRHGERDGDTPFRRSYTPRQGYTLRAPVTHATSGGTWVFAHWNGSAGRSTVPVYTVDDIGTTAQVAAATYGLQTVVAVDSRNAASGVSIAVGTFDLDGRGDGTTRFTRRYRVPDGPFAFTASVSAGGQSFRRWYVDGVPQPVGERAVSVSPTGSAMTIEAEYCSYSPGAYSAYGAGCQGSNAIVPTLASTSRPDIGVDVTHTVTGLAGAIPAVMIAGRSRTLWNGIPLPLGLGPIGANPACQVLAEALVSVPIAIGAGGGGAVTFPLLHEPGTIGTHVYSQVVAVDVALPQPTPLVASNGLDLMIGGSSFAGRVCP